MVGNMKKSELGEDEKVCFTCGKPTEWVRFTQFAGNHPFCEKCAKKEKGFGNDDWEKIEVKKRK